MKVTGQVIQRNIAGENLLIPVGETALKIHGMVTLTESGLLLWDRLQTECSEDDLVGVILGEYDIDEDTARADVKEFLGKLEKLGVLEKGED